mmetsp:Transcript_24764/g.28261  ORF Transcript_24764/g.28261 Transcript_24764/m.28261 type:complete len:155 (+) Transcript_24764:56-520(+)
MSYIVRNAYRKYEDKLFSYGLSEDEVRAARLRMDFFNRTIVSRNTHTFNTKPECDWAYIAKREYHYDVLIKAVVDGLIAGNVACSAMMFYHKRFVWIPFVPVAFFAAWYRYPVLFLKHNKKLFDMCNLGEEYELGYQRNIVLAKCNKILGREDF